MTKWGSEILSFVKSKLNQTMSCTRTKFKANSLVSEPQIVPMVKQENDTSLSHWCAM